MIEKNNEKKIYENKENKMRNDERKKKMRRV